MPAAAYRAGWNDRVHTQCASDLHAKPARDIELEITVLRRRASRLRRWEDRQAQLYRLSCRYKDVELQEDRGVWGSRSD